MSADDNIDRAIGHAIEHLRRMNRRAAPLQEVLDAALKLLMKSLDLQRAVVCLSDSSNAALRGSLGVGDKAVVLAPFFAALFFPPGNQTAALLSAFAAYAAGFLVRPFGGRMVALPPAGPRPGPGMGRPQGNSGFGNAPMGNCRVFVR